jgi:hypothetical protein
VPGNLPARRVYALTHPLEGASTDLRPYTSRRQHPAGYILVAVLAVDR